MEQKCLKSDIYINENYFCESVEQAIDVDFTLPDYCYDISKIFKCNAVPRITSKSVNANTVTVDGNVVITILYCNKEGRFCSFEYNYPFSKNVELSKDATGSNIFARIKCDYINCRAVTGRKVDIHGAAGIFIKVFKRKCREIISDIDDCNIEVNRITTPATVPMGYAEKYLNIEEDLPLGSAQGNIESILKVNSAVCVKETKVINDKAVVKGELALCVLYTPEGTPTPQVLKTTLPYSQIVDIDGITDTCSCDCKAELVALDIKPKPTSMGEIRCFQLNAKILLTCECYCGNDILVVCDAFSRKYETEMTRKQMSFDRISCSINETYICKKSMDVDFNISSVIDLWCSLQGCSSKFEEENIFLNGTLLAGLIICDQENIPVYVEKPIDFQYKFPYKCSGGIPHCDPEIEVLSCSFTITGANSIEITAQLQINCGIYEKNEIYVISDIKSDQSKTLTPKCKGAMVIYYAESGDTVWNIANKYCASVKEITEINGIEKGSIPVGSRILIPIG